MTMNFDMGASNLGSASNQFVQLEGNKIHDVKFKGIEYATSKDGKWEFMRIKFAGENGTFTDTNFGFNKESGIRKKTQFGENPSQYETFMMKVKHLLHAVAPKFLNDLDNKSVAFTPTSKTQLFKQYVEFLKQHTDAYIDTDTQIKLVMNNKNEGVFPPFPTGVSKAGTAYLKTNFIGKGLSFTSKEMENIQIATSAKPTPMAESKSDDDMTLGTSEPETTASDDSLDMEF